MELSKENALTSSLLLVASEGIKSEKRDKSCLVWKYPFSNPQLKYAEVQCWILRFGINLLNRTDAFWCPCHGCQVSTTQCHHTPPCAQRGALAEGGHRHVSGRAAVPELSSVSAAALSQSITGALIHVKLSHNFFKGQRCPSFAERSRQSHSPASSGRWDQTISKRSLFNHF